VRQLDFTPMDAFITHVLEAFRIDANRAVRVFPMGARVILSFCERVANDVVSAMRKCSSVATMLTVDRLENTSNLSSARLGSCRRISSFKLQLRRSSRLGSWSAR
jgi:hypothetical protein